MTFETKTNIKSATRFLKGVKDQIPFINSVAINEVAKTGQKKQRERMLDPGEVFDDIRRPKFVSLSVKIKPFATKRSQRAVVAIDPPGGLKNDVFSKFEEGGIHSSEIGGRLAIPTSDVRPKKSQVIPRRKRPRQLRQRGKSFVLELRNGKEFIAQLTGRGKGRDLQFLYLLEESVPIQPSLEFEKTITGIVFNEYEDEWASAYEKVLGR